MVFLKQEYFALSKVASIFGLARGVLGHGDDDLSRLEIKHAPAPQPNPVTDPAPYARILENELDRQILTEVEREDMDMLDRVRDALYADD